MDDVDNHRSFRRGELVPDPRGFFYIRDPQVGDMDLQIVEPGLAANGKGQRMQNSKAGGGDDTRDQDPGERRHGGDIGSATRRLDCE